MSQGFDFGGLFVALDELKQSIDDRKSDEAKEFAEAHKQYLSDNSFYTNQVTQYKNEIAQHQIDLEALNNDRLWLEDFLDKKRREVEAAKILKANVEAAVVKSTEIYKTKSADYDSGIQVIDEAIELLQ